MEYILTLATLSVLCCVVFSTQYSGTYQLKSGDMRYMQFRLDSKDYGRFGGLWFGRYEHGKFHALAYSKNRSQLVVPEEIKSDKRFANRLRPQVGTTNQYTVFQMYITIDAVDAGVVSVKWKLSGVTQERKFLWKVDGKSGDQDIYGELDIKKLAVFAWVGIAIGFFAIGLVICLFVIKKYQRQYEERAMRDSVGPSDPATREFYRGRPFLVPPPYKEVEHTDSPPSYDRIGSESSCSSSSSADTTLTDIPSSPPAYTIPELDLNGGMVELSVCGITPGDSILCVNAGPSVENAGPSDVRDDNPPAYVGPASYDLDIEEVA